MKREKLESEEGAEAWRFLPDVFTSAYSDLVQAAVNLSSSSSGEAVLKAQTPGHWGRLSSGSVDYVAAAGAARGKNASASYRPVIRNEHVLALKSTVDRRLRKLAREINASVARADIATRVCGGKCKRYCEAEWLYCPWCGSPTVDV